MLALDPLRAFEISASALTVEKECIFEIKIEECYKFYLVKIEKGIAEHKKNGGYTCSRSSHLVVFLFSKQEGVINLSSTVPPSAILLVCYCLWAWVQIRTNLFPHFSGTVADSIPVYICLYLWSQGYYHQWSHPLLYSQKGPDLDSKLHGHCGRRELTKHPAM